MAADGISTLKAMFENVDEDVLLTVLESNNMNVEAAVEELLMLDPANVEAAYAPAVIAPMSPIPAISPMPPTVADSFSSVESPMVMKPGAREPRPLAGPARLAPGSAAALSRPENLFEDHDAEIDAAFYKDDEPVPTTGDPLMDDELFARRLQEEMNREAEEQRARDAEIARTLHNRERARRQMMEPSAGVPSGGAGPSLMEMHQMLVNNPDMVNRFKTAFIPIMRERIEGMQLPPSEGQFESPVGAVSFQVANVGIARVEILPANVDIVLADTITISVRDLAAQMTEAQWKYRKLTFPHIASSGTALCGVSGCTLNLKMAMDLTSGELALNTVAPTEVHIDKLDIKVKGSLVRWLYNLILGIFKTTLRTNIEQAISNIVDDMVNNQSGGLLQGMLSSM